MTLPSELIVTIRRTNPDNSAATPAYLAVTSRANGDEVCSHSFTLPENLLVDLEPQWLLDKAILRTAYDPARGKAGQAELVRQEVAKLTDYGRRLYSLLFGDGERLRNFLAFSDAYRGSIRLTLAMHGNAAALWRMPWEYIHDGKDFLALHGRFLLSRRPYGLGDLTAPPAELPLRILVVISAPDDQRPLDTEEEIGAIQQALGEAVQAGRVQVRYQDDATLEAIGQAMRNFRPHVLHYTGHGTYDDDQGRSYLALEDEEGGSQLTGIQDLRPHLLDNPDLRLAFLSGCQTAQTSAVDAFSGVATGLLQADLPAVVAMQFSILDNSGIRLARAFYASLAQGDTVSQAVQRARLALRDFKDGPGYDWGVPALYLRAHGDLRLVDAQTTVVDPGDLSRADAVDMAGLPLPPHFVGRKAELRQLRRALHSPQVNAAFVRGIGGMGKSSLAAKLIERPGVDLNGVLVIRCHQVDPLEIPAKLASFLQAQGRAGHAEAAALLLDSSRPAEERARLAASYVRDRRYLFVFDNFESVQNPGPSTAQGGEQALTPRPLSQPGRGEQNPSSLETQGGKVVEPTLRGLLAGLLGAQWRSLCLFTGRFRWLGLDPWLGRGTALELALNELSVGHAMMLMDNLPRLRRQPVQSKIAMWRKVGGHPHSIELLEGWLASGRVNDLLADPSLDGLLREQWEGYFLTALLARLAPAQRQALARLSIFRTLLDEEEFAHAGVDASTVRLWLDLSLVQRERGEAPALPPAMATLLDLLPESERRQFEPRPTYTIHPVVRDYLLAELSDAERTALHRWAAAYHGQPFVDVARQTAAHHGQTWTEDQIEWFACDANGVVGQMVARTDDLAQAQGAMARALEWQHHLFAAGEYDPADEIVNAVHGILDRWGQRDRAKSLLKGSIATLEGFRLVVAQSNLATLLKDEGRLDEALATYEAVYATFASLNGQQQMAAVLGQMSNFYRDRGRYDKAIEMQERMNEIAKTEGFDEYQAISLHQLSMLYRLSKEYATALTHSQEAEVLARKLGIEAYVAATLHEQGMIFYSMARGSSAIGQAEAAADYLGQAFDRFWQSLEIERRIGNQAGAADSLGELGKILMETGQMREAIAAFREALEIDQRLNNPVKVGGDLEFLGSVHERQGQYAAALEKYEQSLALLRQYGSPQDRMIIERDIARVRAKMG